MRRIRVKAVEHRARDWFGHPPGLSVLFMTETWEQFSYYGMRALLVYYMTKSLAFGQGKASFIYGVYTALFFLTPIAGGIVSDRWLGQRRAVLIGGSTMAIGHFMMGSPSLFFVALATIAAGNGLFLPSLASQVNLLYEYSDRRRAVAFNIYYVGINLGAFLAPLVCGTLGEGVGWDYGFGAACIGMGIGVATYCFGARFLPAEHRPSGGGKTNDGVQFKLPGFHFDDRIRLFFAIVLAVILYRGAYEQIGNTVALWADQDVNRMTLGHVIPGSWFQSLNPLLIFSLTPLVLRYWARSAQRDREPSPLRKMSLGALGLMMAYLLLAVAIHFQSGLGNQVSWWWFAAYIVLLTVGELYILPVGLGLFARLAPQGRGATTIASWYLAAFAGNLLAGALGTLWSLVSHDIFFCLIAGVAATASILLRKLEAIALRVDSVHSGQAATSFGTRRVSAPTTP